jgi:hypothetical protein
MKKFLPFVLMLVGCSRVNVYTTADKPSLPVATPSPIVVQVPAPVRQPSRIERIAEIDKQLAAPLSGAPDDADRRAQLRAERDSLTGVSHVDRLTRPRGFAVQMQQNVNPVQQNSAASVPTAIVARDSQGESGQNRLGWWESLSPSQKQDYLKVMRVARPDILIQDNRR